MKFDSKSHTAFVTRVENTRIMALFSATKNKIGNFLWKNPTGPVTVAKDDSIQNQIAVSQAKKSTKLGKWHFLGLQQPLGRKLH